MHKLAQHFDYPRVELETDKIELVDQTPNQDFNYNAHGYIRNEIAKLISYAQDNAARNALNDLYIAKQESNLNPELSDEENLRFVVPAKLQDPVEIQRILDYQERVSQDLIRGRYQDLQSESSSEKITFDTSDAPTSE